ncbi:PEP-CTERM sorting domain-containing protein [Pelobacter propionicus]|uniref:Ice-binding protein C-terminal domain-containing protein n=1 Tax=Pelobacter propionicus (strain DSM 2379 / NBRC 103807 / OttBd1) TaxID=338966 RepID=A1AS45_PELPD|nr:PEP-CTERM sorting domain-containing protein [Pelobacter propionicus]ABL00166.1 protein of unknown function DUF1555 [Pelobacter propionicus DSM 2379]
MKKICLVVLFALFLGGIAHATSYTYVGSYAVYDGPNWTNNPSVYSAVEAAALIFGGTAADYVTSINSNTTDPNTITFTAWYDGWGEHQGMVFDDTYKLDTGNPGYNDPYGGPSRSAYVQDGLSDTDVYRNYVWEVNCAPVPEPGTLMLLGVGMAGLALYGKRRTNKRNA